MAKYTDPYNLALEYLHSKYDTTLVGVNLVNGKYTTTTEVLTGKVRRQLREGVHGDLDRQVYILIRQYDLGRQPKRELANLIKNLIN